MSDFDLHEHELSLPLWMVAPNRGAKSWRDTLRYVIRTTTDEGSFPCIFRTRDAADRLVEYIASQSGKDKDSLMLFSLDTKHDITFALDGGTKDLGVSHVAFDTRASTVLAVSIERVIASAL